MWCAAEGSVCGSSSCFPNDNCNKELQTSKRSVSSTSRSAPVWTPRGAALLPHNHPCTSAWASLLQVLWPCTCLPHSRARVLFRSSIPAAVCQHAAVAAATQASACAVSLKHPCQSQPARRGCSHTGERVCLFAQASLLQFASTLRQLLPHSQVRALCLKHPCQSLPSRCGCSNTAERVCCFARASLRQFASTLWLKGPFECCPLFGFGGPEAQTRHAPLIARAHTCVRAA